MPSYMRTCLKPTDFAARFHSSRRALEPHRFPDFLPVGLGKRGPTAGEWEKRLSLIEAWLE